MKWTEKTIEKEELEWGNKESDKLFDLLLNHRELLRRAKVIKQHKDEGYSIPRDSYPDIDGRIRYLEEKEKEILTRYKRQSEIERVHEDE